MLVKLLLLVIYTKETVESGENDIFWIIMILFLYPNFDSCASKPNRNKPSGFGYWTYISFKHFVQPPMLFYSYFLFFILIFVIYIYIFKMQRGEKVRRPKPMKVALCHCLGWKLQFFFVYLDAS